MKRKNNKFVFTRTEIEKWDRLDNASKIFPPNTTKRDTKVFRFACELKEEIDKIVLQRALELTLEEFPIFRSVLRRGAFWYYLKPEKRKVRVTEENTPPCYKIYEQGRYNTLFRVSYYGRRINLEVYHALTDGTGALHFLRTIVYHYIVLKHPDEFKDTVFDFDASFSQKEEDSFKKYYEPPKESAPKEPKSYRVKGAKTDDYRTLVIEGLIPVKQILKKAHEYNTTMTGYLTALFLIAINKNAPVTKLPTVMTIPVNLRSHFHSESVRNFFCTINVGYNFSKGSGELEDVIKSIDSQMEQKLTHDYLARRMNGYSAIERNPLVRVIPLVIKDFGLRMAGKVNENESTASISNIGRVVMPDGFEKYIKLFDVFISTNKIQICLCSYKDNLMISFTSAFKSTDIQKDFFRMIANEGISVEITSNQNLMKEDDEYEIL